jgi:translation initiation factor IF-2
MGFHEVPQAGDLFQVVVSDREARALIRRRKETQKLAETKPSSAVTLEQLFDSYQTGEVRELRLIIKADVQGSLEPIITSLNEMSEGDIAVNVLHAGTGNIGENDIMLAAASRAIVIGFNVDADVAARRLADAKNVSVRQYDIIYRLTEDIEKALKGMLEPEEIETILGQAEVRDIFRISKVGKIAGCRVLEGELHRNARIRVLRANEEIFDGELLSLKHHQDDVQEVKSGFECGVAIKDFSKFKAGDVLESYTVELVAAV